MIPTDKITIYASDSTAAGTLIPCCGGCGFLIEKFGYCYDCNQRLCATPKIQSPAENKREPRTGPKQHGEWWK